MKLGGLVPDAIMTEMVANRLSLSDTAMGFILDGFPRTVPQAQWLNEYLSDYRKGAVLGIISLYMDFDGIAERVAHRRVCPLCKATYNTRLMPPKRIGRCDKDGAELVRRGDDGVEVFEMRLDVFKHETEPLIHYYRGHSLFIEVDADKSPSLVTRDIVTGLTNYRMQMVR
jgi:adenylate kinase